LNDRTLATIANLPEKSTPELRDLWNTLNGKPAPAYRRGFLIRRLAYRIQELAYGGLPAPYQKRLDALIAGPDGNAKGRRRFDRNRPVTGTRLMREWKGVQHEVTVLDDAFDYQGRPYKSLSAIARSITGTRWNSPLFFGLRRAAKAPS
jgi:hypothetical protein